MKNKINENRPLAWAVLAVVVALSIVLGGGGALRGMRSEALDVFYYGVHGDNLSIYTDLDARIDCAYNLASLADRYGSIPKGYAEEARLYADALKAAEKEDIRAMAADNSVLDISVESLYTELENAALSDTDATFALSQYKEFTSRALTISRDGYNAQAEEFNRQLSAFPANLVAAVSGVRELSLFR